MAEIAAAIGVPHGPALPAEVDQQGPDHPAAQLFSAVRSHLDAVQTDVLVAVHEALAQAIRVHGINSGFDLGVSQEFEVDHSILVPLHILTPRMQVPIVPIFIGGIVPPLPLAKRCFALGEMVHEAVSAWPEHLRVAILASSSLLHGDGFAAWRWD